VRHLTRSSAFVPANQVALNVLISGPTGVGKSYLASALGQAACRKGLPVAYRRMPRLFDELTLALVDGSYARVLSRLAKAELLILDDLGLGTPTESQRNDLLEVLEDRYGRASTVVTSQLEVKKWCRASRPFVIHRYSGAALPARLIA
jgi:DNA replication protein DnaC